MDYYFAFFKITPFVVKVHSILEILSLVEKMQSMDGGPGR